MKIGFSIEYCTGRDEILQIVFERCSGTNDMLPSFLVLTTQDAVRWRGEITLPRKSVTLSYHYEVCRQGEVVRREWNLIPRTVTLPAATKFYRMEDAWKDISVYSYLFTTPFTTTPFGEQKTTSSLPQYERCLILQVAAPQLCESQSLALAGNLPMWGAWNPNHALQMVCTGINIWSFALNSDEMKEEGEFKFIVVNNETKAVEAWETGKNRHFALPPIEKGETVVWQLEEAHFEIPHRKGAGVVIPLFSLRSRESCGVGDFGDLKKMIDWAADTGMSFVQLLPINDTTADHTWRDSYPYNAISVHALHPKYIDLNRLPHLRDTAFMKAFKQQRKELNLLPQIDDEAVNRIKTDYLYRLYRQEGVKVVKSRGYEHFFHKNEYWLLPYASFCYLRELYGTSLFTEWPKYSRYSRTEIEKLCLRGDDSYREILFYCYVQYLLHGQMSDATEHARKRGVTLKGDLPIGINRFGVEAWSEPYNFNFDGQAGAPPDDFSDKGQNWGFPTYQWERMAADGFDWWRSRLSYMAQYFGAFRIDHILGFFRIWEIPLHSVYGLLGHFVPALPLNADEISRYGLAFDKERFLQPYITRPLMEKLFGERASAVAEDYLDNLGGGRYAMKPKYDTQRKVQQLFEGRSGREDEKLREGLYSLISNVLFVPDSRKPDSYHPRILWKQNEAMQNLTRVEQEAYKQLYDDYFYHRHNDFWYNEAMKKLPSLTEATRMLACGEDLGMVPECVGWVMEELRILSLEIQRMPKNWNNMFGHLQENPYLSVCTISTHDMPTLRGWWEENSDRTRVFYHEVLGLQGEPPEKLTAEIAAAVVRAHLQSTSMLCLLAWQDWMALDGTLCLEDAAKERINEPQNPRHYWRYRMNIDIEELQKQKRLNDLIRSMIDESGRKKRGE